MSRALRLSAVLVALLALCPALRAEVARAAVVVGANVGHEPASALRYAERDAARVARALASVCGVEAPAITLIMGGHAAEISAAVDAASARLAGARAEASMLFVYYSGHADGESLEIGSEPLPLEVLRTQMEGAPADLKILIIDACHSGAITRAKGWRPAPGFDVSLVERLDTSGLVILAASADAEAARESERLQGSTFTHHLLSGLQGAADRDEDDRVTLREAYQYAYGQTVVGSVLGAQGPQRPTYEFDLSGRGEVVIADLSRADASLRFGPDTGGQFWVIDPARGALVAELSKPQGATRRLALPRGRYQVAQRHGDGARVQDVRLSAREEVQVRPGAMRPHAPVTALLKGPGGRRGRHAEHGPPRRRRAVRLP